MVTAVAVALFVTSALWFPRLVVKDPSPADLRAIADPAARLKAKNDAEATRNSVRGTLLQGIGGALILGTLWVGVYQIVTSRRGQDTDRFNKSIEQVGHAKPEIRLGGIYALAQMTRLRPYRRPIAEIFAAYVRTQATPSSVRTDATVSLRTSRGGPCSGVTPQGHPTSKLSCGCS